MKYQKAILLSITISLPAFAAENNNVTISKRNSIEHWCY